MGQYTQDELMFNDKLASRHRYNTRGFKSEPLVLKPGSSASGTGLANYTADTKWIAQQVFHSTNTTGGEGAGQQWGASRDGGNRSHEGIDLQTHQQGIKYVYPIGPGHIEQFNISPNGTGGNNVKVNHGNGIYSEYMHLANSDIKLTKGQEVTNETPIGIEGNTGKRNNSSKPYAYHLHFGIYQNDTDHRLNPTAKETEKLIRGLFRGQGSSTGGSSKLADIGPGKITNGKPPISENYDKYIENESKFRHVDPDVVRALLFHESSYDPKSIGKKAVLFNGNTYYAEGIGQYMPYTSQNMKNPLDSTGTEKFDPFDPGQAIIMVIIGISDRLRVYNGDYRKAVAAHNTGMGEKGSNPLSKDSGIKYSDAVLTLAGKPAGWTRP